MASVVRGDAAIDEQRRRITRDLGWLIDLAAPVTDGGFIRPDAPINWESNLQLGPYILRSLPKTFHIMQQARIPLNLISLFAVKGLTDQQLPFPSEDVDFLTRDRHRTMFLAAQDALVVSFQPGEHKNLSAEQIVPFTEWDDDDEIEVRRGRYGVVVKVLESSGSGVEYCEKRMKSSPQAMNEAQLLASLPNAPHLLQLRASYTQGDTHVLILHPWVTLDLRKLLDHPRSYDFWKQMPVKEQPSLVVGWMQCLLAALTTLHSYKKKHIDLKPDNIGLKVIGVGEAVPYILDHGHSREVTSDSLAVEQFGSAYYASPEKSERRKEGRKGDVFSLGIIFVELLGLVDAKLKKRWERVLEVDGWELPPSAAFAKKPSWFEDLFNGCHDVVTKLGLVITEMLRMDSGQRISAHQGWLMLTDQGWIQHPHCYPVFKEPSPLKQKKPDDAGAAAADELLVRADVSEEVASTVWDALVHDGQHRRD